MITSYLYIVSSSKHCSEERLSEPGGLYQRALAAHGGGSGSTRGTALRSSGFGQPPWTISPRNAGLRLRSIRLPSRNAPPLRRSARPRPGNALPALWSVLPEPRSVHPRSWNAPPRSRRSSSPAERSSSVLECSSSPPERSTCPLERAAGAEYRQAHSQIDA